MSVFVGLGTIEGGGLRMQSTQVGFPTATTDPVSANVGDIYIQTVGSGATMRLYNGSSWNNL